MKNYSMRRWSCIRSAYLPTVLMVMCLMPGAGIAGETATLLMQKVLSSNAANRAALAAVAACREKGYRVSAAVVDKDGVVQSLVRGDGAGVHTVDSSRRKAYTAVSMGRPTQKFAELVAGHPDLHALGDMNASILLLGGGFPIRINGRIIGGIGVGGAPGAQLDESCARAGLKELGADLYR